MIDRIEHLTAVERLPGSRYRCICDCGNERIVNVGGFNARYFKSCGCHVWHGQSGTRTYISYHNMMARCHKKTNSRYSDYGGSGIFVCDSWRESFKNFYKDMGDCPDGLTIDRRDNTKGYSPENCRWVTRKENSANRKNSIIWVVDGREFRSAIDAGKEFSVSNSTITAWCRGRIAAGRYYPKKENCWAYYRETGERTVVAKGE